MIERGVRRLVMTDDLLRPQGQDHRKWTNRGNLRKPLIALGLVLLFQTGFFFGQQSPDRSIVKIEVSEATARLQHDYDAASAGLAEVIAERDLLRRLLADRDTGRSAGVCTDPIGTVLPGIDRDARVYDDRSPGEGSVSAVRGESVSYRAVNRQRPSGLASTVTDDESTTPSSTVPSPVVRKRSLNPIQADGRSFFPVVRPDSDDLASPPGARRTSFDRCYCGSRSS